MAYLFGVRADVTGGERTVGKPRTLLMVMTLLAAGFSPAPAQCNNGLNLIGFGAESVSMGGADLTVTHTPAAININPAGLTGVMDQAFEFTGGAAFATDISHQDPLGNDARISNNPVGLIDTSFARQFGAFTLAAGFFIEGGAGNVYKNMITPAGNRDELSSLFGILRTTFGFGWRVNNHGRYTDTLEHDYKDPGAAALLVGGRLS
jgi:long-chain fatty acid transport protein